MAWHLLFISYKFVKVFLAIIFLLLVISSWNFHDLCQRFLFNQKRNFSWIRPKMRNFPIDPHHKKAHFCNVMSIDMTLQKLAIFIMGVYGENLCLLRIKLKFCSWLYKKRWHTSWKFQLEIRGNKKVIAEKPLTNLHEMNSRTYSTVARNS